MFIFIPRYKTSRLVRLDKTETSLMPVTLISKVLRLIRFDNGEKSFIKSKPCHIPEDDS